MIRDERGVSLPELLLVLAIIAVIASALVGAMYQIVNITNRGNNELAVQHDLRNAAVWLNRDVLSASRAKIDGSEENGIYYMTLEVPYLKTTPEVTTTISYITYTYYEDTGDLTRDPDGSSVTIARHIVTNPFPPLGTDIYAPDPVTVTLVSLEGNVPVSSTFALKMRAGGTVSVAWEPAPTPECNITGEESLEFEGDTVKWEITNTGSDTTLVQIDIDWPEGNGALWRIDFGESMIWTGGEAWSPETTTIWPLLEGRTILSETKTLESIFANTVITTPTEYSITVIFTNTCTVSFNP